MESATKKMIGLLLPLFLFAILSFTSYAEISNKVGVNYGQLGNNLPPPPRAVELIKSLGAKRVKIYDADPEILKALINSDLEAHIMVPNNLIPNISKSQSFSDQWVKTNVVPFYPDGKIRYLMVGNEILTNPDVGTWFNLVPAMRRIKASLKTHNLKKIKVGTTSAFDVLGAKFPPSNASFRPDISDPIIKPMLQFLNHTKSFYFLNVYTYFTWAQDSQNINLDYALLKPGNVTYTDPLSKLTYYNLFDQLFDAVVFAMKKLGYPNIPIFIEETGWPSNGDLDQIGANLYNAATFNRNLVHKLTTKPSHGTPAHPGSVIPAIIFALFNENTKTGPTTERNFGLYWPNGTKIYDIDLSGKTKPWEYKGKLPVPTNNVVFEGKIFCVVNKEERNLTAIGDALKYACSQGNKTCDAIQKGGECYKPDLVWRASYAFSSYWAEFRPIGGTCYFNGLAVQITKDPSYGRCKFPSVNPAL